MKLAAIRYSADQGTIVDAMLVRLVETLRGDGCRLAGAVQHNLNAGDRRCDGMMLEELASGTRHMICETIAYDTDACRIDETVLAQIAERSRAALRTSDILVVNKFGKREARGRGFTPIIALARDIGIPVLVGVNDRNADAWRQFSQSAATEMNCDHELVLQWCRQTVALQHSSETAGAAGA